MSATIVRFPDFPDIPDITNTNSAEGFLLVDLAGWWDGVDARLVNESRPDADGDFDQDPVHGGARYPIITGCVQFSSEADLYAARKPLARLAAYRHSFTLQVESLDGIQQATVVRNGRMSWDMSRVPGYAEFEIPLKASDPRKYGVLQSGATELPVDGGGVESPVASPFVQIGGGSLGRVTLTNNGTVDTIPTLTISGGGMAGGVELTRIETAEKLRLEWPILDGDVVRFSPGDGQVWLNEQSPISGYLTIADWWTLDAGDTATVQFAAIGTVTGTPILTAEWRDADS